MKIAYLYNYPEYVEIISRWIYSEFVEKSKSKFTLEQVMEYFSKTNLREFPITIVAIKDGKCVGTVSIFENDLKTVRDLSPWLAVLFVNKDNRKQRIGEMLIDKTFQIVKELGFKTLYLRTEHTAEYYKRLGWKFLYRIPDEYGQTTEVFKCDITF